MCRTNTSGKDANLFLSMPKLRICIQKEHQNVFYQGSNRKYIQKTQWNCCFTCEAGSLPYILNLKVNAFLRTWVHWPYTAQYLISLTQFSWKNWQKHGQKHKRSYRSKNLIMVVWLASPSLSLAPSKPPKRAEITVYHTWISTKYICKMSQISWGM